MAGCGQRCALPPRSQEFKQVGDVDASGPVEIGKPQELLHIIARQEDGAGKANRNFLKAHMTIMPAVRSVFQLWSMPDFVMLRGQESPNGDPTGQLSPPRTALWRDGVAWAREESGWDGDSWITSNRLEGLFGLHQAWTFNGTDVHFPTNTRLFGTIDLLKVTDIRVDGDQTVVQLNRDGIDADVATFSVAVVDRGGVTIPVWHALDLRTEDGTYSSFLCEYSDWRTVDGITLPWSARRSSWTAAGIQDHVPAPERYRGASRLDQSHCTTYQRMAVNRRDAAQIAAVAASGHVPTDGELVWHESLGLAVRVGDPFVNLDGIIWRVEDPPTGAPPESLAEFMKGSVEFGPAEENASARPPRPSEPSLLWRRVLTTAVALVAVSLCIGVPLACLRRARGAGHVG